MYYTKDHEWVKVEGNTATVGITEYAAKQLGDVTFVEKPVTGKDIKKGQVLCDVESVKAASEVYSPVSGKIAQVNGSMEEFPGIVSSLPESDGWIAKIEMSDPSEASQLMNAQQYGDYIRTIK
ncbi:MAG: glycine cleavage system protein GcvH [Elusimicrobia bacterium]|nr:glycine cleavage system protein GcvH [Elusimicrobiota bacterium]